MHYIISKIEQNLKKIKLTCAVYAVMSKHKKNKKNHHSEDSRSQTIKDNKINIYQY